MSFLLVLKTSSFFSSKKTKYKHNLKKTNKKNKNPAASPEWLLRFKLPCYHAGTGGRSLEAPLGRRFTTRMLLRWCSSEHLAVRKMDPGVTFLDLYSSVSHQQNLKRTSPPFVSPVTCVQ
ncbi:hypothetical protein XENOCAPTIV_028394 [Xenoophorus captivus]|uniref:Uncharacterized protein n=1 Tax=Xenoophorus captivus TaxID=1517983 RepID=A0ABV0QKB5_9TELE